MRFGLVLVAAWTMSGLCCPARSADVQILAQCGESNGSSYYFEGGYVGPGQGGWKTDGYRDGRITALLNDKGQVDIIIKDAAGVRSYLTDGMKVALTAFDEKSLSFIITAYSKLTSGSYLFKLNKAGVGTLVWTESKVLESVTRSSIMVAECGPLYGIKP